MKYFIYIFLLLTALNVQFAKTDSSNVHNLISPIMYAGYGYNSGLRLGIGFNSLFGKLGIAAGYPWHIIVPSMQDKEYVYSTMVETPVFIYNHFGFGAAFSLHQKPKFENNHKGFLSIYVFYQRLFKKSFTVRGAIGYNDMLYRVPEPLGQLKVPQIYLDIILFYSLFDLQQ
ncbi:MAG: hypothetical protein ACK5C0_08600 [Candidatus Kapaibacterium sp.]|jgi:hypothetical protein